MVARHQLKLIPLYVLDALGMYTAICVCIPLADVQSCLHCVSELVPPREHRTHGESP